MRPDLYRPPDTDPRLGRGAHWLRDPNRPVKLLILLAVVVGLGATGWRVIGPSVVGAGSGGSSGGRWVHDLDAGFKAGAASGKPVLVLYTADWCPPCRLLKREVLSDPAIDAFMARVFVRVKIDLTDRRGPNNQLAAKARITGIPTMIVYTSRGVETTRLTGGAIGVWIRSEAGR